MINRVLLQGLQGLQGFFREKGREESQDFFSFFVLGRKKNLRDPPGTLDPPNSAQTLQTLQTTCGSVGCASYLTAIVLPPPAVAAPSAHGGSPPATPAPALGKGRQQRVLLPREGGCTRQLRPLKVARK